MHIWRRDTVAQAVSKVRADQSGRWSTFDGDRPDSRRAVYDLAALEAAYRAILDDDASWQAYFALHHIQPVEVVYEELIADYEGTIRRAAAALGEHVGDVPPPRLARQGDAINLDWARRFRAESAIWDGDV